MAALPLKLPTIQNWSCHNCSGCCRQHAIAVTPKERDRIEKQNWPESGEIPADQPLFVPTSRVPWNKQYRLAHQPDGACVFLNEEGLCRIHAKFGESAKPLACRVYPYALHPAGKQVTVSLRYSCPSVVNNLGRSLDDQRREFKKLQAALVPERADQIPPPKLMPGTQLDWPDTLRVVQALDQTMAPKGTPVLLKLLRALCWIDLVRQSRFDRIRGERLDEFLEIIRQSAESDYAELPTDVEPPSRIGQMQFRMLAAQYARKDTSTDLEQGLRRRWELFRAATRFTRGTGTIPKLQGIFGDVEFSQLELPFGTLPERTDEIFTRYFRVKIQGMHFCGPAYYNVPTVEGFQSLALIYPAILWIARWLAATADRGELIDDDIVQAMTIADHHHGYSPIFGWFGFRRRVRNLAQLDDISRLCQWYSR